jgi:hypothetical protein
VRAVRLGVRIERRDRCDDRRRRDGEIDKHKYNERLFLGTLAAGGTLGILIPPSINMIIYGVMTDTSVPKLYLAGFIPGFILTVLFSLTVLVACIWKPHWGGEKVETSWEERWRTLPDLLPPTVLLLIVVGAIFFGLATCYRIGRRRHPRRARDRGLAQAHHAADAARGVRGHCAHDGAGDGDPRWRVLPERRDPDDRAHAAARPLIRAYELTPGQVLTAVIVLYLVLGTFMEELSMMISTIPITTPLIIQAGYDPVWFGILLVLLIQTAMISPPFGINLFVIHGIRGRGTLSDVEIGSGAVRDRAARDDRNHLRVSRHGDVAAAGRGLSRSSTVCGHRRGIPSRGMIK